MGVVWQSGLFPLIVMVTYTEWYSPFGVLSFPFHSHSLSVALKSTVLQKYPNLSRWFHHVSEQGPIKSAAEKLPVKTEEVWTPVASLLLVFIDSFLTYAVCSYQASRSGKICGATRS